MQETSWVVESHAAVRVGFVRKCLRCGTPYEVADGACRRCGAPLTRVCHACGREVAVHASARFLGRTWCLPHYAEQVG